jgi:hypothetical protein
MKKKLFQLAYIIILSSFTFFNNNYAQLKKINKPNAKCESDIYMNEQGVRYSKIIAVHFNDLIFDLRNGKEKTTINDALKPNVKEYLNSIKKMYGNFSLVKILPAAEWGDTIRTNKRTGKKVSILDMSQAFRMEFEKLIPIDSIITSIKKRPFIISADEPMQIIMATSPPSDSIYASGGQWELGAINALGAWDITKGSQNVFVSIHDDFYQLGQTSVHQDLGNKVYYRATSYWGYLLAGYHGT